MSGKKKKGLRKGGPEGLRKAHEARAGHGPEDAGAQGVMQGDREGAGQVALDGERRGGVYSPDWPDRGSTNREEDPFPKWLEVGLLVLTVCHAIFQGGLYCKWFF